MSFLDQNATKVSLAGYKLAHPEQGEEIVISGLSGCYPDSDNVNEFRNNLFNKMHLSYGAHRSWKQSNPQNFVASGRMRDIDKFDAGFFGIHSTQAHRMDTMCRMLMERSFEAVLDAGINPKELRGTNTGVFIGTCLSDEEKVEIYEKPSKYSLLGYIRATIPYRLSQALGVNGPSYQVDTACSSSMYAVEHAYRAVRTGLCETAIVGGCIICLDPYFTLQHWRLGVLNSDGKCKCFDESADGYTRSEASVVIVLQKSSNARRIYAQLVHAKAAVDGFKAEGINYPSGQSQSNMMKELYAECQIDPREVEYMEAHATSTRVGDVEEVSGIDSVFCKDRSTPLLIGSVKSNMGHAESAAGLCSISKVIFSMESGYLIPNILFNQPRDEIEAILSRRIKVVTEVIPWKGGYVPINSFGFGGANCHVLLKSNCKEKINNGLPQDNIPRLVYVSGRTEEAVEKISNYFEKETLDVEYIRLLHDIFKEDIPGHIYRGYAIISKESLLVRQTELHCYKQRELWYIFSGLSSQWCGMGKELLNIPLFAATIERCQHALSVHGVNIIGIIRSETEYKFANITEILVGITAMQIGLADLLTALDLKPAGSIGYSIGEIACAYYHKCLTLEQAILCSYYLGQCITKFKKDPALMLSVKAGVEEIKPLLPKDVQIACYNSENNCVVTGSYRSINELQKILKQNCIDSYELKTNETALHSIHMEQTARGFMEKLKNIINEPKLRPENWLSTSAPNTNAKFYKYCCAEFLANVICSPVLFEEEYNKICKNNVILEVSPHGVLQSSTTCSINNESISVELLKRNTNSIESFLNAIGKVYLAGFNPHIENIYPKINYPVSRGTPMISHLIKWDHSQSWHVTQFDENLNTKSNIISIKLRYPEYAYLAGHNIDGRVLFPATGYLGLIWQTVSLACGQNLENISIVFENVKFHRATYIAEEDSVNLTIRISKLSGYFEVAQDNTPIVNGSYYLPKEIDKIMAHLPIPVMKTNDSCLLISNRDFYKEMHLRGYKYKGVFRSIQSVDLINKTAQIKWQNNYVAFMNNVLQMQLMFEDTRSLFLPTTIERLCVDTIKHSKFLENLPEDQTITAYIYKNIKTVVCGGIEMKNVSFRAVNRREPVVEPVLETFKFTPNKIENTWTLKDCVRAFIYIITSSVASKKFRIVEVVNYNDDTKILSKHLPEIFSKIPLLQADVNIYTKLPLDNKGINVIKEDLSTENNCAIVILSNGILNMQMLQTAFRVGVQGSFVISREDVDADLSKLPSYNIEVAQDVIVGRERLLLLHKTCRNTTKHFFDFSSSLRSNYDWVKVLQEFLEVDPNTIIYSHGDEITGLLGFMKCLRREPGKGNIRCVLVFDKDAPAFDPTNEFYATQLKKGLAFNVFKNGKWGQYIQFEMNGVDHVQAEHSYVNVTKRGDLSSVRWLEGSLSRSINHAIVDIYYAALNFRDVMTAVGKVEREFVAKGRFQSECVQGLEYSGRLADGRRVMGIVSHGATSTMIAADDVFTFDVPDEWTLEEAATVPCVYGTVLFAFHSCNVKKQQTILIHCGAGGIGQAAINIARLMFNCTVFVTVGSPKKREFIKQNWPEITDDYIGNSRDTSFVQMVMKKTKGRGVDVVLNSLSEEKLLAGVRCLAEGGRFIEIGKFDLSQNNPLPVKMLRRNCSFHGITLDALFASKNTSKSYLCNILNNAIKKGFVKPLQSTVFEQNEIEEAFRYMASGKHIGKVLIRIREEEPNRKAIPVPIKVNVFPRFVPSSNGSYIITGGLGGFGLELTDWLVMRGLRKVLLNSRRGITSGYQSMKVQYWKSYGVDVIISTDDSTTESGCRRIIEKANELGPVHGIFNLSLVLRDAIFENQSLENFKDCLAPKALTTKYLDEISRKMCPELRKFVIFSSGACGRGNVGQTNYGMANAIMERICEKRQEAGLPALAIEWGIIGDVGIVVELKKDENDKLVTDGAFEQPISNCLTTLDKFLTQNETIVSSMVIAEKKDDAEVNNNVIDAVVNVLGIKNLKTITTNAILGEVGLDSIMTLQIKNILERNFGISLRIQDIRTMTFARLFEMGSEASRNNKKLSGHFIQRCKTTVNSSIFATTRSIFNQENTNKTVIVFRNQITSNCCNRVFMIPGIDGLASSLEILASKLNADSLCFQFIDSYNSNTIPDLACKLLQEVLKNLNDADDSFTIVGYSFGAAVALELASLLEEKEKIGNIILIGGSPDTLKQAAIEEFNTLSAETFENNIQLNVLNILLMEEEVHYVRNLYEKFPTLQDKLNCVRENIPKEMEESSTFLRDFCNGVYARLNAIIKYEPKFPKLKSSIKLIKPTQSLIGNLDEDLGLSRFSDKPVEIVEVEGTCITLLENKITANEIQKSFNSEK